MDKEDLEWWLDDSKSLADSPNVFKMGRKGDRDKEIEKFKKQLLESWDSVKITTDIVDMQWDNPIEVGEGDIMKLLIENDKELKDDQR